MSNPYALVGQALMYAGILCTVTNVVIKRRADQYGIPCAVECFTLENLGTVYTVPCAELEVF